jgi:hypothetical protein
MAWWTRCWENGRART